MTKTELEALMKGIAAPIVHTIKKSLDHRCGPLEQRVQQLEAEIETLKSRPQLKWAGVFVDGVRYAECSLVTRSGGLWVATTATTTTPGESDGAWRLVVKSGHAK